MTVQETILSTEELHSAHTVGVFSFETQMLASEFFDDNSQHIDSDIALLLCGDVMYQGKGMSAKTLASAFVDSSTFESFYNQLSGSFWLFIADKNKQAVYLVNDHLSIMPCYYLEQNGKLYFSTSLKQIKRIDSVALSISKQAIFNYLYFHCIPSPTTIYEESYKLEPGVAIVFKNGRKEESLVFSPLFHEDGQDTEVLKSRCMEIIDASVNDSKTDNCGAFLSGGLDSSTVAGMLAKHMAPAKTFSVGFESKEHDETYYAQLTAKHFGTEHEVLYLQSEQAAEKFVEVAQYFDEPFGNSSAMAAYFCATFAKSRGVDHLLAGDGGDELFAGNERYVKQKQFELYYKLPSLLRSGLNFSLNNNLCKKVPILSKASSYVRQAEVKLPSRLQSYNFVNIVGLENMFNAEFLSCIDVNKPIAQLEKRYHQSKSANPVNKMLYLDWKFTLADNDLIKVNKMCELAGVKVSYPLINKGMVEFSAEVPADVKLPGFELRDFYKKACRGFLADETLDKSKHGFGLPFGVWLKENQALRETALSALESFKKRKIVSESLIEQALDSHQSVHSGYYGELIWIMVVLELWLQKELGE